MAWCFLTCDLGLKLRFGLWTYLLVPAWGVGRRATPLSLAVSGSAALALALLQRCLSGLSNTSQIKVKHQHARPTVPENHT